MKILICSRSSLAPLRCERSSRATTKPALAFKSTDKGKTWTEIKIPPIEGRVALAVAMHTKGQRLYIIGNNIENGSGFYRSDDGGATWQHMAGKDTRISNGRAITVAASTWTRRTRTSSIP